MIKPIAYPVRVSAVRRRDNGSRVLDIVDSTGETVSFVYYDDRGPDDHLVSMRTAHAVADALNHCLINIATDGAINPSKAKLDEYDWKGRALRAEAKLRYSQRADLERAQRSLRDSWDLSNLREEAQRRRDREIGEMGGGG